MFTEGAAPCPGGRAPVAAACDDPPAPTGAVSPVSRLALFPSLPSRPYVVLTNSCGVGYFGSSF